MESALPQLHELTEARLALMRQLASSLEESQSALLRNDAEKIARGAAHQAELCRRWSYLESQLRREREDGALSHHASAEYSSGKDCQAEWNQLNDRIRHLTRVHSSLLRHLNRSLAVLARVAESCELTYAPSHGTRINALRVGG